MQVKSPGMDALDIPLFKKLRPPVRLTHLLAGLIEPEHTAMVASVFCFI